MSPQPVTGHRVTALEHPAPPPLLVGIFCPDDETVVVAPTGEADISTALELLQAMSDAIASDRRHVVVDLDHLTFMDASTLRVLVAARLRTSEAGKTLQVRCGTRQGLRLLRITGLDSLLSRSA